jgi:hypothetical protein
LFLRKFGVPFGALARVFGRDPMFYYRPECAVGRANIVGVTVKVELPEHLAADEHHLTRDDQKIFGPVRQAAAVVDRLRPSGGPSDQ